VITTLVKEEMDKSGLCGMNFILGVDGLENTTFLVTRAILMFGS
jgi:hypothetical protein